MSKIVSSPIFMPRLMNQDGAATEIGKLPARVFASRNCAEGDCQNGCANGCGCAMKQRGLSAKAELFGMTSEQLKLALESGKTFQQIAEEKGISLEEMRNAVPRLSNKEFKGQKAGASCPFNSQ